MGNHSENKLTVHIVWITKYRYKILDGEVKVRCRELIIQICEMMDTKIIRGVLSKDHVHLVLEYPPKLSISYMVQSMKGRSSKLLQDEFPHLSKKYYGKHFWAVGYGAWSIGGQDEERLKEYLKHHNEDMNDNDKNFVFED